MHSLISGTAAVRTLMMLNRDRMLTSGALICALYLGGWIASA